MPSVLALSDHGLHRIGDYVAWLMFRDFIWHGVSLFVHLFTRTDGIIICLAVIVLLAFFLWRRA